MESIPSPVLEGNLQQNDLLGLDHQAQDAGMQEGWEYGGRSEHDLHGYSSEITEGKNIGKIQCILCGKISRDAINSFRHVEAIHFSGSFVYDCDQCDAKFDTKSKWASHR